MPGGPGDFDADGIWNFGEADDEGMFSDTLNLLPLSLSGVVGGLKGRLDVLEAEKLTVWRREAANTSNNASFAALSFDATSQTGSLFTHAAGVFTCQSAGLYLILLSITYAASATGFRGWRLVGSGSLGNRTKQLESVSAGLAFTDSIPWFVLLDVNDTITAQGQQSSGGNLSTSADILFLKLA